APYVLQVERAGLRAAGVGAEQRAVGGAQPVAGGVHARSQPVAVEVDAGVQHVVVAQRAGAAQVERAPAGAAHVGHRTGTAPRAAGGRAGRIVFELVPVVVAAGHGVPVPTVVEMAVQLGAVEHVGLVVGAGSEAAGGQGPDPAAGEDGARVHRLPGGVADQAAGGVERVVVPPAQREQRVDRGRDVHADLQRRLGLPGVLDAVGAVDQARRAVGVAVRCGAAHRHGGGRVAAGLGGGVLHRLAVVVELVEREQPAPAALPVAQLGGEAVAVVMPAGAVTIAVVLAEVLRVGAGD